MDTVRWLLAAAVGLVVPVVVLAIPLVVLVAIVRAARAGDFGSTRIARAAGVFIALGIFAGLAFFIWGTAFGIYAKERESARKAVCLSNVKHLSVAALDYAEDHGGMLPAADEWCDALLPYVDGPKTFRCPRAHDLTCAYAFNSALGGMRLDDIAEPEGVIMIFESDAGWNASGGLNLLAEEPRHIGGDDYGFADGHAAWMNRAWVLKPESEVRWDVGVVTASSDEEGSVGAGE